MNLKPYLTHSGRDVIMNYINRLPLDEKIDGLDVLQQMQYGNFDSIYTKSWEGNIKEAYFYKHNRIFYFIADGENIYLLHACRKQKNKTEKRDADIVRKRAKELQAFLKSGK